MARSTSYYSDNGDTTLPRGVAKKAKECDTFSQSLKRKYTYRHTKDEEDYDGYYVHLEELTDEQLRKLAGWANASNNKPFAKICQAVINFEGVIPSFEPAYAMIIRYLRLHAPTGWIYNDDKRNGTQYPYAIDAVRQRVPDEHALRNREEYPTVSLSCDARAVCGGGGRNQDTSFNARQGFSMSLTPSDLTRKTVAAVLENHGVLLETPELRAAYDASLQHMDEHVMGRYGQQFRIGRTDKTAGRKAILDTEDAHMKRDRNSYTSSPIPKDAEDRFGGTVQVPLHPTIKVFTLDRHSFEVVPAEALTPYVYDPTLADKLILPETHMDMLDILTTNLDAFMSDIIEGKSAGNIILCKGMPGVGKTLTAEVYSEIIGVPIYSVHSGALGTTPDGVERMLRVIFERVEKWDCILLLDEADVFVSERGSDLVQNAIVSVFLRVLEYFGGLMFMTTNRSDNIDDAIISRCAAVIDYGTPTREDMRAIWEVMAKQQGITLSDETLRGVLHAFPSATPRDIKYLMRLCLRVSIARNEPVTTELFRRVAQFRAVEIAKDAPEVMRKATPEVRRRVRAPVSKVDE
jgi:hypothetical protein